MKTYCNGCKTVLDETYYCYGCDHVVCDACNHPDCVGPHEYKDHFRGKPRRARLTLAQQNANLRAAVYQLRMVAIGDDQ